MWEAENHVNRFNVEAFPAHSLPSFLVSVVVVLVTTLQVLQSFECILDKKLFTNFLVSILIRPYSDHRMSNWKWSKDAIPVMNASLFLYCFDLPSSERSGLFSLHLASFSEQVIHTSNALKLHSDKSRWGEQQNSSILLWLDCTDYRAGMNKRQYCS